MSSGGINISYKEELDGGGTSFGQDFQYPRNAGAKARLFRDQGQILSLRMFAEITADQQDD